MKRTRSRQRRGRGGAEAGQRQRQRERMGEDGRVEREASASPLCMPAPSTGRGCLHDKTRNVNTELMPARSQTESYPTALALDHSMRGRAVVAPLVAPVT